MPSKPQKFVTDQEIVDALSEFDNNKTLAAKALSIPRTTLFDRLKNINPDSTMSMDQRDNCITLEVDDPEIKTAEEALKRAKIDTAIWQIERTIFKWWDTSMKIDVNGQSRPHKQRNYGFTVYLKRKIPRIVADGTEEFMARISDLAPKFSKRTSKRKLKSELHWAVFSVYDTHFGKLAWKPETGENYDLQIAEDIYSKAVDDLLDYTMGREITQIDFPVGNDALHIDKLDNTTTAGTPQDTDGRLPKIFNTCCRAHIRAVGRLLEVFPAAIVYVKYVPGNHDYLLAWFLTRHIETYFKDNPKVVVDSSPSARKYSSFGCNAILFTHGKEEKVDKLSYIMAAEKPKLWAATECREAHIGHGHRKGEIRWVGVEESEGFVVRRIPSLTPPDAWHYLKGYVNNRRAAEVFLYSRDNGYTGQFSANVS